MFDLEVARTGLGLAEARAAGLAAVATDVVSRSRAKYYPGSSPLHVRLRHLDWQGLPAQGTDAALRADGLAVLVTGPSAGGPATLTVRSAESVKPHVVVARFAGDLPRN